MKSLSHIGVFVSVCAVEHEQSMRIIRKMRRHPVENHSNACLVKFIDESHQSLGIAEARGRSEEPSALIAPASIEGMFHHWHKLHVCESHFFHIRNESFRKLVVRIV